MITLENFALRVSSHFMLQIDCLKILNASRFFIIGPSGSGKTTLMKSLAGLKNNHQGSLRIDGREISASGLSALYKYNIMFLTQELGLWSHMSAAEHLSFVMTQGASLQSDGVEYWLDMVDLKNKQHVKPHKLSGGEQKRLALARVLCTKPRYLFLDEPFANIDPVLANELMGKIDREQKHQNFTLIKVTHHYYGISDENTTIVVMHNGQIIQRGNWQEISQHPNNKWIEQWAKLACQKF